MTYGITAELEELIALKRFANKAAYPSEKKLIIAGNHFSQRRGRGMVFSEVRNYQAGDEIRHMEWRVMAKTGRPHVKVYEEEKERPVVILADFSPSMHFGTRTAFKSVVAARLSALIAWTVVKQGDRIGALLYGSNLRSEFIPRAREAAVLPLLASLSAHTQPATVNADLSLSDALQRLRRVTKTGSTVVVISDFYTMDADCSRYLGSLRSHNQVLVYHVCDALELNPPPPGLYAMTNGSQELLLDTNNPSVRDSYENWSLQRQLSIQTECKRLSIPYHLVKTDQDLVSLVRQTFPRGQHG